MRWDFLLEVLKSLSGFSMDFVGWIENILQSSRILFWLTAVLLGGFLVAVVEFFVLLRRFLA